MRPLNVRHELIAAMHSAAPVTTSPRAPRHPSPGHHSLRDFRASIENRTYFITACSHNRLPLFESDTVAMVVFEHLHSIETDDQMADLLAAVVMPDHLHAIVTLRGSAQLASVMKRFRGASAQRVNRCLQRTGTVWQRAYYDRLLRLDESLEMVLQYLWHNPHQPGHNFRCRREIWRWFRTCVGQPTEYSDWLQQNP